MKANNNSVERGPYNEALNDDYLRRNVVLAVIAWGSGSIP